ncbi:GntR family transcriptional regulator [Pseudarthrobacter sp. NPDC058196]|uniref:GntR family transcriptional regulator n=1 Tax=Pseudarthrobacter sp. NPDC058196 TaxID=3346376 RepID=UPI0036DEAECF
MRSLLAPLYGVEAVGEELEVSATPVREALQALRVEGFLQLVPGKGFTVVPLVAMIFATFSRLTPRSRANLRRAPQSGLVNRKWTLCSRCTVI